MDSKLNGNWKQICKDIKLAESQCNQDAGTNIKWSEIIGYKKRKKKTR